MLSEAGTLTAHELCRELGISIPTARRNLADLEARGLLRRTHGGAILLGPLLYEPFRHDSTFEEQLQRLVDEKRRIALVAASLVNDGEVVALTAGTTTTEVARNLRDRQGIKVVTNAVNIAMELSRLKNLDVFVTGGHMRGEWFALAGPEAVPAMRHFFVDKAFIGVNGLDPVRGLTCFNPDEAELNRAMVGQAKQRIIVTDHSKLSVIATHQICPLEEVNMLITDSGASDEAIAPYLERGIELRRA
jgi:DeoR family transcriptional regulator of aga operon